MGQMRVLANLCAMRIHNKAPATVRVHEMFVKIPCGQTPGQNPASFSATACAPCPNSVHTGIACHSVRTVTELDRTNSDLLFVWQLFIYPPFLFIRCIKTHTHTPMILISCYKPILPYWKIYMWNTNVFHLFYSSNNNVHTIQLIFLLRFVKFEF